MAPLDTSYNQVALDSILAVFQCDSTLTFVGYQPTGPQVNVPISKVEEGGWTECHKRRYNQPIFAKDYEEISQTDCKANFVMVGCRKTKSNLMKLLAWAKHSDVFGKTADKCDGKGQGRVSEGTRWYSYEDTTWGQAYGAFGFADEKSNLKLTCPDTKWTSPKKRLSWRLYGPSSWNTGGYR